MFFRRRERRRRRRIVVRKIQGSDGEEEIRGLM